MIANHSNHSEKFENLSFNDFNEMLSMVSAELEFEKEQIRSARKAVAVPHVLNSPKAESPICKGKTGNEAEDGVQENQVSEYETPNPSEPFNLGILFRQAVGFVRPQAEGEVTRGPSSFCDDGKELPSEPNVWIATPADAVDEGVYEMLSMLPAIEENVAPDIADENSFGLYSDHVKSYIRELKFDPFNVFAETEI
eukprot:GHVP01002336.1.p2 GENE.GHVP01002336.1~~GHVP01002336.1.p2  ORF type:complete len:196 (+),score=48.31 GHVP01002336.1:1563-2150(+)